MESQQTHLQHQTTNGGYNPTMIAYTALSVNKLLTERTMALVNKSSMSDIRNKFTTTAYSLLMYVTSSMRLLSMHTLYFLCNKLYGIDVRAIRTFMVSKYMSLARTSVFPDWI